MLADYVTLPGKPMATGSPLPFRQFLLPRLALLVVGWGSRELRVLPSSLVLTRASMKRWTPVQISSALTFPA